MTAPAISENSNTIDLIVDKALDIRRYQRAMYGLRAVTFRHEGCEYTGEVLSIRRQIEPGTPAWLVKIFAKPHVAHPLKRPQLRWTRGNKGDAIVC